MEYTVKGNFIRKDTMEIVATGEATIVAEDETEYAYVVFELDTTSLGGVSCVAYEYVYHNDVEVGKHEDPEDPDQIINYPEPELPDVPRTDNPPEPETPKPESPKETPPLTDVPKTGDTYDLTNNIMLSGIALVTACVAAIKRRHRR